MNITLSAVVTFSLTQADTFKKYSYFSFKHNAAFIVNLTLLHVSALCAGHHQAMHYIKTNMDNINGTVTNIITI
jgi:hypothetical protein